MRSKRFNWWAAGLGTAVAGAVAFVVGSGVVEGQERGVVRMDVQRAPGHAGVVVGFGEPGSYLGVEIRDVTPADAADAKLAAPSGAYVADVEADSPAQAAGIQAGDIVVSFDGERVRSARQLTRLIDETPADRVVRIGIQRDGRLRDIEVTPKSRTAEGDMSRGFRFRMPRQWDRDERTFQLPALPFDFDFDAGDLLGSPRLGVEVQPLTGQLADYFGVKRGLLVTSVAASSAAEQAGIKAGDVVVAVNDREVERTGDLRRELSRDTDGMVSLRIVRDKKEQTVSAKLPEGSRRRMTRIAI